MTLREKGIDFEREKKRDVKRERDLERERERAFKETSNFTKLFTTVPLKQGVHLLAEMLLAY